MNLQEFLKQKGLTIDTLGKLSKVSVSTIKRALKGENINATSTDRLTNVLEVSEADLKTMIQAPPSSDYISKIVHQQLNKLSDLGMEFKAPSKNSYRPVYWCIENDLRNDLSYFPDEFQNQVNKAENAKQLEALKALVMYCTAYLLERDLGIDLKEKSLLTLTDGNNAWELRIFINAAIEKLEGVAFKLRMSKESGAPQLAPVERAHQLGLSSSTDAMELVLGIAKQLNTPEPLTNKKCPDQLRKGNDNDLKEFKAYCDDLNGHLGFFRNSVRNIFAFSEQMISEQVARLLTDYLPALRMMIIKADQGDPFLLPGNKIQVVLINLLKMVNERENKLFAQTGEDEEKTMTGNEYHFNAPVGTVVTENTGQVDIGNKLNELIPVLQEMKQLLAPNLAPESEEMKALNEAIIAKNNNPKETIKKIDNALNKAKKIVNQGTSVAGLYTKAEALFRELTGFIS